MRLSSRTCRRLPSPRSSTPPPGRPVDGFELTDITYHRAVGEGPRARHRADRVRPARGAQRVPPAHGRRALPGARPRADDPGRRLRAAHRQRAVAEGRRLGVLLRAATSASAAAVGYQYAEGETADTVDAARVGRAGGRLHILEVQRLIRTMPKVVVAVVPGWAAGGGHSLHVVCDLTIACGEHARFKQTDADVGSFDGGYGSAYLAKMVGPEVRPGDLLPGPRLRRRDDAPHGRGQPRRRPRRRWRQVALEVAAEINGKSPTAQRMLKFAFNLRRRRPGRAAGVRRRGDPARLHDRRGRRGPRRVPGEARPRLVAVPLVLLSP